VLDVVALSVGLGAGALASRVVSGLREHRSEPACLADLLNWGFMIDDGPPAVVLQKDGSLVAGWSYRGPDLSAATSAEIDALSEHVNAALLPFTDNWMFHVDAIRRPAGAYHPSHFTDPVCQLIDDERREAHRALRQRIGGQFETSYVLIATFLPPADAVTKVGSFFVQEDARSSNARRPGEVWEELLGRYRAALRGLESRLGARLGLVPLGCDALVTHLHECLTGQSHAVRTPPHGAYLDSVLADQELVGGFEPRIGGSAIRVVAIQGYPDRSRAGELDALNALGFSFRWSTRLIPIGTREAARLIRRHQLQWFKKRKGAAAWAQDLVANGAQRGSAGGDDALWQDQDARAMAEDAASAAAENAHGEVRYCYLTQCAVLTAEQPLEAQLAAGELLKTIADAGFTGRIETVNALEAFLGSLPGHGYPNLRRPLLSTRNVADLLPLTSVWPGLPHNPSPLFPDKSPPLLWAQTAGSTPFRLNIHDSDVGHTLVIGPTGAGKSVLLGLMAAQFRRYPEAQVFAFDVGYSMWTLGQATRALHHDLAAGRPDSVRLQPLSKIDEPSERVWAAEWIEALVELQGLGATPRLRARIDRALELLARNERAHRTLTELCVQVQDDALASALRPYTVAGHYGQLLDAGAEDLQADDFTVFELKHLLALDDRVVVPVLLYLFRCIERRLGRRPTLIEIDEAWLALMHSTFGRRVNQWLLMLRKQNAAVVLATQSPSQLAQSAFRHTVLDSCPTRIYLPNAEALTPGQVEHYRDLGLNDGEISSVARSTPKRHYYFKSPRGSRLFELGLGPVALAFLSGRPGATVDETRREVEALAARDARWPAEWLESLGLGDWATRYKSAASDRLASAPRNASANLTQSSLTSSVRGLHEVAIP
jgi:type IV secretion system protein VirB4